MKIVKLNLLFCWNYKLAGVTTSIGIFRKHFVLFSQLIVEPLKARARSARMLPRTKISLCSFSRLVIVLVAHQRNYYLK